MESALETPGASKDIHRLERRLQWLERIRVEAVPKPVEQKTQTTKSNKAVNPDQPPPFVK
ncbi:hypothetical protein Bca52824_000091 [Brassica carinata]|uniref:Uncharacterized protein n=1 Tax=Brassica carinata TaxID=52824 RepID=A0A8X7WFT9_BRACI|nr:hypothetical protein Bca52824_000091 [Brassica carinata]